MPIDANSTKKEVLAELKANGMELEFASPILLDDKEVVIAAIYEDQNSVTYASERLKKELRGYPLMLRQVIIVRNRLPDPVKEKLNIMLEHMHDLFVRDEASADDLTTILSTTLDFFHHTIIIYEFNSIAKKFKLNVSPGKQALGEQMITLGAAFAGLTATMITTSVGAVPIVVLGVTTAALVASGMLLFTKGKGRTDPVLCVEMQEVATSFANCRRY
jgi:hypothetical protein